MLGFGIFMCNGWMLLHPDNTQFNSQYVNVTAQDSPCFNAERMSSFTPHGALLEVTKLLKAGGWILPSYRMVWMKTGFIQVNRNMSLSSGPKWEEKSVVKWKCDVKTHESFCLVWLVGDFFLIFCLGFWFFYSKILAFTAWPVEELIRYSQDDNKEIAKKEIGVKMSINSGIKETE